MKVARKIPKSSGICPLNRSSIFSEKVTLAVTGTVRLSRVGAFVATKQQTSIGISTLLYVVMTGKSVRWKSDNLFISTLCPTLSFISKKKIVTKVLPTKATKATRRLPRSKKPNLFTRRRILQP